MEIFDRYMFYTYYKRPEVQADKGNLFTFSCLFATNETQFAPNETQFATN